MRVNTHPTSLSIQIAKEHRRRSNTTVRFCRKMCARQRESYPRSMFKTNYFSSALAAAAPDSADVFAKICSIALVIASTCSA